MQYERLTIRGKIMNNKDINWIAVCFCILIFSLTIGFLGGVLLVEEKFRKELKARNLIEDYIDDNREVKWRYKE